jgi:hypothetical protein
LRKYRRGLHVKRTLRGSSSSGTGDRNVGIFFEHAKTIYVEPFELPASGKWWMSYDHGSTKPYACLFWWESDGSDIRFKSGRCRSTRPRDLLYSPVCLPSHPLICGANGAANERPSP